MSLNSFQGLENHAVIQGNRSHIFYKIHWGQILGGQLFYDTCVVAKINDLSLDFSQKFSSPNVTYIMYIPIFPFGVVLKKICFNIWVKLCRSIPMNTKIVLLLLGKAFSLKTKDKYCYEIILCPMRVSYVIKWNRQWFLR